MGCRATFRFVSHHHRVARVEGDFGPRLQILDEKYPSKSGGGLFWSAHEVPAARGAELEHLPKPAIRVPSTSLFSQRFEPFTILFFRPVSFTALKLRSDS